MRFLLIAAAVLVLLAPQARAETQVEAGLWEKTETVRLDGADLPARQRSVCLKPGEASLERLLLVNDDEARARGCTGEAARPGPGVARIGLSCPASDAEPAIAARLEVQFTPTSFEATGEVEIKASNGTHKGTSTLSGKRVGDC